MKEVVNKEPDNVVNVKNVTQSKFYGILRIGLNDKGFITKTMYGNQGLYCTRCIDGMTYANAWINHEFNTIEEIIRGLLSNRFKVYEFDDRKEFFTWLAAD